MYIAHLSLTNFRNYLHQELELPSSAVIIYGDNAQGKTNLLEAIYILATTKSHRTSIDRELVNWETESEEFPVARIYAKVEKAAAASQVEISFAGQQQESNNTSEDNYFRKRIRINGLTRRTIDAVGHIRVVMFSPQDTDLIGGSPAVRRRYLDATNSQINPVYLRNLQRYNKVLLQRNHLLKLIREHRADSGELAFWDEQLIESGSYIINQRRAELSTVNTLAREIHYYLTSEEELLDTVYIGSVNQVSGQDIADTFRMTLNAAQTEEIARGMSIIGPHRDDIQFLVGGKNMGVYGSRGQHRTIALSLKLAEARFMLEMTDDAPILLLDDVLSELDYKRRGHLLDAAAGYQQTIITTTDLDHFETDFIDQATKFRVTQGRIEHL